MFYCTKSEFRTKICKLHQPITLFAFGNRQHTLEKLATTTQADMNEMRKAAEAKDMKAQNGWVNHLRSSWIQIESRKQGFGEETDGGTLFLEKIEYLAVELQSALLQVIKQGVITRLDARRLIPIDVKVIATTTADLAMLVEQNRFSRQLYYALHAFEITIPPLRMRRGSIPALVNNKLRSLEKRFSTRLKIDDDALARLVSCAWPGNDFELYSVIENLALSSDNGRIRVSDLPEHLFTEQATDDVSATRLSTSLSFAEVEKEAIINAAQVTGGRIQEMSALLGIGRTTLWRKMKKYGISR